MAATTGPTTNFVSVHGQGDVITKVTTFINDIESDLASLLSGKLSLTTSDEYVYVGHADLLQLLHAKPADGVEQCIKNIFLETILKLNKKSGFASLVACLTAIQSIKRKLKRKHHKLSTIGDIETDLHRLSNMSRHVDINTIRETLSTYLCDPLTSSMVMQAYNLAGHSGQIFVDKEFASASCVELMNGYTFSYGIVPEFAVSTKTKLWKETGVKCLIIDGIVETVSEIHHVLQYFFEEKWPGIIVCRGFGEEVLGTLIANYNRQTLNVIPIIVPYDLEGMNALKDIAIACGGDVISSLKGELISSIDISEISTVEKITLSNKLIISNPGIENVVRLHLSNILEQKENAGPEDKKDLFDKRTKALASVCTHIKIDSHQKHRGLCFNRIDHGIKLFREMAGYGGVELKKATSDINDGAILEMLRLFIENEYKYLPAYSLILGCKVGEELADTILSSAVYLIIDN